jgi:tetratricopeptide (TPR) repeat protein
VWRYLLALNLWAVDRQEEAATHLEALGSTPAYGPFYVARARLTRQVRGTDPLPDLRRAVALDPESRILHIHLIQSLQGAGRWAEALSATEAAASRFSPDFNLQLLQARSLINLGQARQATEILADTHVLPSENARESHRLYEQAHTLAAMDAMDEGEYQVAREHLDAALLWPESLGQGRPYEPEERLIRFLLGRVESHLEHEGQAREAFQAVVDASSHVDELSEMGNMDDLRSLAERARSFDRLDLLALPSLHALGRRVEMEEAKWGGGRPLELGIHLAAELRESLENLEGRMILRALGATIGGR